MLALSSDLDENKAKVSEKSYKIISPISYLLAALFLPLQARDQMHMNDVRVHRLGEGTAAVMYTALFSSQVATAHGYNLFRNKLTRGSLSVIKNAIYDA